MLLGVKARQITVHFDWFGESLGWVLQGLQVWSAWICIIMGIGMLQNAFNPAGSGWVHYHICLIQRDEPRLTVLAFFFLVMRVSVDAVLS